MLPAGAGTGKRAVLDPSAAAAMD